MVGYYRLKELGFRLAAGAHVVRRAAFEPVEAAAEIVAEAERKAASIVAGAEAAHAAERARGYEDGLAMARIEAAERLLGESAALDRRLAGVEHELVDIVAASVRRLIDDFDDRTKAETLVRTALRQMRREKRAELRVSPAQFGEMRQSIDRIVADFPEVDLVDIVEDDTLSAPQIIVETAIGRVEGDLGRSLDELVAILHATASAAAPILLPALPATAGAGEARL